MKRFFIPFLALVIGLCSCDSEDVDDMTPEQKQAQLIHEDVNGEYLLSKIYNGDFVAVSLLYNNENKLTNISKFSQEGYSAKLDLKLTKEYNKEGKITKLIISELDYDYNTQEDKFIKNIISFTYDSKGNLVKIHRLYPKYDYDVYPYDEYFANTYDNNNQLVKTEKFFTEKGIMIKEPRFIKYDYNTKGLRTKIIFVDEKSVEITMTEVKYDDKGNPIEISKYIPAEYDWGYNPITGEDEDIVTEASFSSFVKIEYDYTKKNFLKHSLGLVFPELSDLEMINAPSSISSSEGVSAGSITYDNFNEGGYPKLIKYLANDNDGNAFNGEIKLEFIAKK